MSGEDKARDGKSKEIFDISINQYIAKYISKEIYRYMGRNISTDYFFVNEHPSSSVIWCRIELIFSICWTVRQNWYESLPVFKIREHEKLITTFFTGYFTSPFVCHKNLRFCWKLWQTITYSLELEKLIITFFKKKMQKCEFVTTDIYWKIYRYTPIYRTPI